MFFRRRRRSLLELILIVLGLRSLCCRSTVTEIDEANRDKAKRFRTKLKEAFAVWDEEEAEPPAEPNKAEAVQQG